ncbi:MAG: RNase adapter RapZ [Pseudomonadota bacterium]|nr:RNase adapter RapZ [Pseudomonadota bacterium]
MQLILISGLSGSGKSVALRILEDSGYFCVDNLPAEMLEGACLSFLQANNPRVAISVDSRSGASLAELPQHILNLQASHINLRLLFLEANLNTLVKRFSESRRPHPLSNADRTLPECVEIERGMLAEVANLGLRIDTSDLNPVTLRMWIRDLAELDASKITLLFQSFGFKHGLPLDADFVFDVRCLPNPHYDPALKPYTGRDACIIQYLEEQPGVQKMLKDIHAFINEWLPEFIRDNRSYLTIAIGCTGGQHRSVYLAEQLAKRFSKEYQVLIRHRELTGLISTSSTKT